MRLARTGVAVDHFVGETHLWHHRPSLHRDHPPGAWAGLAGASAFRGIEGYGGPPRRSTPTACFRLGQQIHGRDRDRRGEGRRGDQGVPAGARRDRRPGTHHPRRRQGARYLPSSDRGPGKAGSG